MRYAVPYCLAAITSVVACTGPIGSDDGGIPPGCGDGVKTPTEVCDGADLGGATCATAAARGWSGIVSCTAACQLNTAGCTTPATTWNAMTADNWSLFNIDAAKPGAKGFISSVFDGRYLYFVPYDEGGSGLVTRYDTQANFAQATSWATFDIATTITTAAKGFFGGAFDGRYVYFVPHYNGAYHGTIARYDTQGQFDDSHSWSAFDISSVNSGAKGFATAVFDGRYLYLAPFKNTTDPTGYDGIVARYDTKADFGQTGSWSTFDIPAKLDGNAKGFLNSAFDGRYLYLIPHHNGIAYNGIVARYDTKAQGGFSATDSWTTFDVGTLPGNPVGFLGSAFDGRYLYLVQNRRTVTPPTGPTTTPADGWIARYDTQANFKDAQNAWTTFNIRTINDGARGFWGTTFDGRYLYLVPFDNSDDAITTTRRSGLLGRYDTSASFTAPTSWQVFDLPSQKNDPTAIGYNGAGFDGRYVYLAPRVNGPSTSSGLVARFDAKTPPWLPVGWNRAFD